MTRARQGTSSRSVESRSAHRAARRVAERQDRRHRSPNRNQPSESPKAQISVSNLASSVARKDLEQLFSQYRPSRVSVHYDERGRSLGTADVFVSRTEASRLLNDFRGITRDADSPWCRLKMTLVVGDYSIKNRGSGAAFDMPRYEMRRTGAISKRQRSNHSGRKDQKRKEKPKISKEELDRELEEYMSNRKNAQKEDTAEADQSGLTETLELLSGSQKTAEDNRKSPVVECSSSSNSTETKETPKDDIDMEIDADLEALMQN